jgi:HEPN domain-containing protein
MPPDSPQPGSAEDWLRYAVSDLQLAKASGTPNVLLESLCYHAQQCAEKALKAALVAFHIPVPKTHSIGLLLDLLSSQTVIPADVQEAAILTDYAVMSRYPGDAEPVTQLQYEEAVHLAETVATWARRMIMGQHEAELPGETPDDVT